MSGENSVTTDNSEQFGAMQSTPKSFTNEKSLDEQEISDEKITSLSQTSALVSYFEEKSLDKLLEDKSKYSLESGVCCILC